MCELYQGFTGPGLASLHSGPFPGRPLQALTWPGKGHLGPCVPSQKLRSRAQALIAHSSLSPSATLVPFLGTCPALRFTARQREVLPGWQLETSVVDVALSFCLKTSLGCADCWQTGSCGSTGAQHEHELISLPGPTGLGSQEVNTAHRPPPGPRGLCRGLLPSAHIAVATLDVPCRWLDSGGKPSGRRAWPLQEPPVSPAPLCSSEPRPAAHTSCQEGRRKSCTQDRGTPRPPPRLWGSPLQAGLAASTLLLVALLTAGGLAQLPLPPLLLQPLALLLRPPLLLQPAVLLLLLRGTHSARCAPAPPVPARGCSDSHTLPDP